MSLSALILSLHLSGKVSARIMRALHRFALVLAVGLIILSMMSAMAAANTVPASRLGTATFPVTPNDLKPPECAALNLTSIVIGSGTFSGTGGNNLILGSSGNDTITAGSGTDCVLGGAGNDTLRGNGGNDVIIGSPAGTGTLRGDGGGADVCYARGGSYTFHSSCETQVP